MVYLPRLSVIVGLVSLTSAAIVARQKEGDISLSAHGEHSSVEGSRPDPGRTTDSELIAEVAETIDQKSGPGVDEVPNQPVPDTIVTVVDGEATGEKSARQSRPAGDRARARRPRAVEDYTQVFAGTGTGASDRDASVQGTAYLTFTLVSNSTYNIEACLDFCSSVSGCVFANLYYEFNNYGLDFEASEQSNLKCAVYGEVHTAVEKTNFGGQQSYPAPAPLIYIQHSGGWGINEFVDPGVPSGYEYVFGPINGATSAPGYMGFVFLDRYDVHACAVECNQRAPDAVGGYCQFFNIWTAVVSGVPTTYTCSMYYTPTDASTATNTGQWNLQVTASRGYRRKNFVIDGGFEGIPCSGTVCLYPSYANWIGTSPPGGTDDATFWYFAEWARRGHGSASLGSAPGFDALPGTITPRHPLATIAGKQYRIEFWQHSSHNSPESQAPSWVDVIWNGVVVLQVRPGYSPWSRYTVVVTASGNDILAFQGGQFPAYTFLDDISAWQL
ncbi:hypothetical protein FA15DRAFT_683393 [Coprinopsis marcescibilis]|uniref:Fruit-body specific protein a n=1 Tax=Coprinopsis marcescibilis TaxID=230819 RepID=A0A5C3KDK9_COPMA|nr:hypothetical protein FA15DRAFT_683393 [Coprinopsis marcescibilis]